MHRIQRLSLEYSRVWWELWRVRDEPRLEDAGPGIASLESWGDLGVGAGGSSQMVMAALSVGWSPLPSFHWWLGTGVQLLGTQSSEAPSPLIYERLPNCTLGISFRTFHYFSIQYYPIKIYHHSL